MGPTAYAVRRAVRDRDAAWLMHPGASALVTAIFAWNALPRLPALLRAAGARRRR